MLLDTRDGLPMKACRFVQGLAVDSWIIVSRKHNLQVVIVYVIVDAGLPLIFRVPGMKLVLA